MKAELNENEVIEVEYIDRNNYKEYIGKTVKVTGNVLLRGLGLTKIPINFTEVGGSFYCSLNKLTSLEGAPRRVGRDFYFWDNQLTSLVGSPKFVGGSVDCSYNQLTDLEGAPEKVGGDFKCAKNQFTSYKGKPKFIGGEFIWWLNVK